jgi:ubiquinone/menaquinone biosynthesis C-methylase UbiE
MDDLFASPLGPLVAKVMACANAGAEAEAIDILAPSPSASLLVIGFGAGVGIATLVQRHPTVTVVGVDPSPSMHREAARRNRAAVASGRVRLLQASADAIACPGDAFDGVLAVNALQMCEPFDATAAELARVMRRDARLVTLTHDWAMARHAGSVENWVARVSLAFQGAGFGEIQSFAASAEKGHSIALLARRLH